MAFILHDPHLHPLSSGSATRSVVPAVSALRSGGGLCYGLDPHDVVHGSQVLCAHKARPPAEPIQRYCSSGSSWRGSYW
eukprot:1211542-Heterocapsa_arctica.AAC.1